MNDVPLRSISISDFRRLEGTKVLPLDAPIVLLHGPNGAGKTSVLSALELGLTGQIRSMRRQDPRYTAHLPHIGQDFATIRVDVSDHFGSRTQSTPLTVGGSRIEGTPALGLETAQFYSERCYLDQVSLGQLLELYQYRDGKEESALARFVNELLGLEQLDAIRSGLHDATDLRLLKKLSERLADAADEAQRASTDLSVQTQALEAAKVELAQSRIELLRSLGALGHEMPTADDETLVAHANAVLSASRLSTDRPLASDLDHALTALGGRIAGLSDRPSTQRLEEARASLTLASEQFASWRSAHEPAIEAWRGAAAALNLDAVGRERTSVASELDGIRRTLASQDELLAREQRLGAQVEMGRSQVEVLLSQLSAAQEHAGSLAEGLATLRSEALDNVCPVCNRDYSEVSSNHLVNHIDRKISELTDQGRQLIEIREQRGASAVQLLRDEGQLEQLVGRLLPPAQREEIESRHSALEDLRQRLEELEPVMEAGQALSNREQTARIAVEDLEAAASDAAFVSSELERFAEALDVPHPGDSDLLSDWWRQLSEPRSTDEVFAGG